MASTKQHIGLGAKKLSISVFFPCYNDAGSIGLLIKDAFKTLKKISSDFEIIVIDDGSQDESRKILQDLKEQIKELRLVFHSKNRGYGGALRSGFGAATKDLVFYTDGDGQYDVKEITKLLEKLTDDVDVVQGYKIKRNDPIHRLIIGWTYHHFSKLLFGLKVKDVDCDFRLIRRKALDSIKLEYDSGVICVELVKKLQNKGLKFAEVAVSHYPRLYGHSQFFNYKRVIKTLVELTKLWFDLVIVGTYEKFRK